MEIFKNEEPLNIAEDNNISQVFESNEVVIIDGYAVSRDYILKEGDRCIVIQKGALPQSKQLKAMITARNTPKIQDKLDKSTVVIFGVGGLGSNIAIMLARVGVGNIVVVDYDIVEPSNLNRQSYFINDLGKFKVDAIKEQIEKINPFVQVVAMSVKANEQNIADLCKGANVVCEAFDDPIFKAMLVNNILLSDSKIKIVASSGMAGFYSANEIRTTKKMNRLYICGDGLHDAKKGEGLMSPRVGVCAAHQANMILRLLLDYEEA